VHPARSNFYANEPYGLWWTITAPHHEDIVCETNGSAFLKHVQRSARTNLRAGTYRTFRGTTFEPGQIPVTGMWDTILTTALAAYAAQRGDNVSKARLAALAQNGQVDRFAMQFAVLMASVESVEWQNILLPADMILPTLDRPPPTQPEAYVCRPVSPSTPVERSAPQPNVQQPRARSDVGTAVAESVSVFGGGPTAWQGLGDPLAGYRLTPPASPPPPSVPQPVPVPGSEEAVRSASALGPHPVLVLLGVGVAAVVVWQLVRRS